MIKMIYTVTPDEKAGELEWLKEQKIFPGYEDFYDWKSQKTMVRIGVIVAPEAALSIKLRHKLDLQDDYNKK